MLAFMAAGGTLAAAGIWMMLRESAEGVATKVAIGPVQVQTSAVGFTAFLTGATIFTVPLIAPEASEKLFERVTTVSQGGLADLGQGKKRMDQSMPSGVVPSDAEPMNDTIDGAALVQPGDLAGGQHTGQNSDWFQLDTSSAANRRIEVEISERIEDCYAHFYDGQAAYMGLVSLMPGRNQFDLDVNDNASFYLQLGCMKQSADDHYYVTFEIKPEQVAAGAR